jgi:hypothetical protein
MVIFIIQLTLHANCIALDTMLNIGLYKNVKYYCVDNLACRSHLSAESQIPEFASFEWLSNDRRFTEFYCRESSVGDSDADNIERMSRNINQLVSAEYDAGDDPLANFTGNPDRVKLLKKRLLSRDVALCVNDKCHVFTWAGEFCERFKVPTLNLCPSQHEIQRHHAGLLDKWKTIFGNMTPRSQMAGDVSSAGFESYGAMDDFSPIYPPGVEVPVVPGLYITYAPIVPDVDLIPPGREVVGPVYLPLSRRTLQDEEFAAVDSEVRCWLDKPSDCRPVVYVSLGSMVKVNGEKMVDGVTMSALRTLFAALIHQQPLASGCGRWRVLAAISPDCMFSIFNANPGDSVAVGLVVEAMARGDVLCAGWVPQFEVLAHPAIRAFVSHCGANSVHEAIFHGKPIVAMPFFDDQRYNGPRLVELGLASACLLRETLTQDTVGAAVRDALDNETIASNLLLASAQAIAADGLGRLVKEAVRLAEFSSTHLDLRSKYA